MNMRSIFLIILVYALQVNAILDIDNNVMIIQSISSIDNSTCGHIATYSDDGLELKDCKGNIQVHSIMGNFTLLCSKAEKMKVFGPFELLINGNECHLMGHGFCNLDNSQGTRFRSECLRSAGTSSVILIIVLIIINLTLVITLRYLWITRISTIKGHRILSKRGKLLNFELEIEKIMNNSRITYVNRPRPTVSIDTPNIKIIKYSGYALLLALLVFKHPHASAMENNISGNKEIRTYRYDISVTENKWINIGNHHFNIPKSESELILGYKYNTSEIETKLIQDWHCHQRDCNSHGECGKSGALGTYTSTKIWFDGNTTSKGIFRQRFCQWGTTGCFFADGCWKWVLEHRVNLKDQLMVYSIDQIKNKPKVLVNDDYNCVLDISSVPILSNLIGQTIIIDHSKNKNIYLCQFQNNQLTPKSGELGDLQIFKNRKFIIARDRSTCFKDPVNGPTCDIIKLNITTILDLCVKLPTVINGFSINLNEDRIFTNYIGMETVTLTCTEDINIVDNVKKCGGVEWTLWVHENSNELMRITGKTKIKLLNESISVLSPCSNEIIIVPCDYSIVTVIISWSWGCLKSSNFSEKIITTQEELNLYHHMVKTNQFTNENSFFEEFNLLSMFKNPFGISLSSSTLILIMIIILILCKR